MFEFLTQIIRLVTGTSKRQIGELLLALVLIAVGIALYERWTASFRLSKLERAVTVVESLSKAGGTCTNHLAAISEAIATQLQDIICPDPLRKPAHGKALRFLLGLLPWVVMGFLFLPSILRKGEKMDAVWGSWAFGAIVSFFAMFLPDVKWPWFHVFVYPLGVLFCLIALGIVTSLKWNIKNRLEQQEKT